MEDTKYYIPSLEELHIGFEYEYLFSHVWGKRIVTIDDFDSKSFNITKCITDYNNIRVKYLDKEDIESLLIKHNIDIDIINDNGTYLEYNLNGLNSIWFDINNPCKLFIKQINANNSYRNDVLLNIKNKNELDKLLKQLQIL